MNNDIGNPAPSVNGNLSVDPHFGGSGNYQLAATSPLLGMGTTTPVGGLPTINLNGNPRSYSGLVDIGAYERGDEIFGDGFED
ncbi:MAG: choice-of-anchor Q domain-containing protein [Rudaea sp.]|nr:choice-of-anchor Q domain-containing protein [Rudaea sp.]